MFLHLRDTSAEDAAANKSRASLRTVRFILAAVALDSFCPVAVATPARSSLFSKRKRDISV